MKADGSRCRGPSTYEKTPNKRVFGNCDGGRNDASNICHHLQPFLLLQFCIEVASFSEHLSSSIPRDTCSFTGCFFSLLSLLSDDLGPDSFTTYLQVSARFAPLPTYARFIALCWPLPARAGSGLVEGCIGSGISSEAKLLL